MTMADGVYANSNVETIVETLKQESHLQIKRVNNLDILPIKGWALDAMMDMDCCVQIFNIFKRCVV